MRQDLELALENEQQGQAPLDNNILELLSKTDIVELPSKGRFYNHPTLMSGKVEIKQMTTIHEDILSNQSYIKDGSVFNRLLKALIVDKSIDPSVLLSGDSTAILYAARGSAYGDDYQALLTCPACNHKQEVSISLTNAEHYCVDESIFGNAKIVNNQVHVQFKINDKDVKIVLEMMTLEKENYFAEQIKNVELARAKKAMVGKFGLVEELSSLIVEINGVTNKATIKAFVEQMPAGNSKEVRRMYKELQPRVTNIYHHKCPSCGFESSDEVGMTTDFFWPKT